MFPSPSQYAVVSPGVSQPSSRRDARLGRRHAFRSFFPEASEISHRLVPEFTSLRHKSSAGRKFQPYESRLLSARDFARTIGTGGIEIVESDSIHRMCATIVNRQAFGKLRSQTYSKFSSCFSFRASVYVTVPQIRT